MILRIRQGYQKIEPFILSIKIQKCVFIRIIFTSNNIDLNNLTPINYSSNLFAE